eukprot:6384063-Karenia_brevis.AAC.1
MSAATFLGMTLPADHLIASSMQCEIITPSQKRMSPGTFSLKPVARRVVVMLRGPGLVHMRQTQH